MPLDEESKEESKEQIVAANPAAIEESKEMPAPDSPDLDLI